MTYQSTILAQSPDLNLRLGEASGTTAADSSGNGRDGTYNGTVTYGATGAILGDSNTAATFSGASTSYVSVPFGSWMNRTANLTVICWFKTTSTNNHTLVSRYDPSNSVFSLELPNATSARFFITVGGSFKDLNPTVTGLRDGNWHMAAATYDGSQVRILIDGAVVGTAVSATGSIKTHASDPMKVGLRSTSGFNGSLDEVYFGPAISDADIATLYALATATVVSAPAATATASGAAPTLTADASLSVPAANATAAGLDATVSSAGGSATVEASTATATADGLPATPAVTVSPPTATATAAALPATVTARAATYSAQVLADGPIAYYRLGDTSGTQMTDASSNARHGVYNNSPTLNETSLVPNHADPSVQFDGTNDFGQYNTASFLNGLGTAFTAECWFKRSSGTAGRAIIDREGTFWFFAGTSLQYGLSSGGAFFSSSAGSVSAGNRYHAVMTYNGSTLRIYLNGTQIASHARTGAMPTTSSAPFCIGAGRTTNTNTAFSFWPGWVDEVSLYNKVLSATEIADRYALGLDAPVVVSPPAAAATASAPNPVLEGDFSVTITVPAATGTATAPPATLPDAVYVVAAPAATATAAALPATFAQARTILAPAAQATASAPAAAAGNKDTTIAAPAAAATADAPSINPTGGTDGIVVVDAPATAAASAPAITLGDATSRRVHRWTFYDPATEESWEFPINPNKMASPHSPRNLRIFVNPPLYNPAIEARGGMARVFEGNKVPYEWNFSGYIRTEDHYTSLLYWSRKTGKVHLTDHLGRTWVVRMVEFSPDEKRPTFHRTWRMDYQVKAINYGVVA